MNLISIYFLIFKKISAQCEYFEGPRNGLETYCESEIKDREFKMVVREAANNPIFLQEKLTCLPRQYQS